MCFQIKCFALSPVLLLSVFCFLAFQKQTETKSETFHSDVLLAVEVDKTVHVKDATISVKYQVKNTGKQDIYLIVGEEPLPGYNLNDRKLSILLTKQVLTYHSLEMPKLKKIEPKKTYKGKAMFPLSFLREEFIPGEWKLYVQIGYLNTQGMTEMHNLMSQFPIEGLAEDFSKLQKEIESGPLKIRLDKTGIN